MGQQQILILVLVVIIVVLGILLGSQLFRTGYVNFVEDEYNEIMLETAELLQATYEKPEMFGGGNHNWDKVNFSNVPCTFGVISDPTSKSCRKEDGSFIVFITGHGDHLALNAVTHIGGKDADHLYTRQMVVYADSIKFSTDWIGHQ